MELRGLEPLTSSLQSWRSGQLSYSPWTRRVLRPLNCAMRVLWCRCCVVVAGVVPAHPVWSRVGAGLLLRKEVIQPQVPLRLPCYDFTPVMNHTVVTVLRKRLD